MRLKILLQSSYWNDIVTPLVNKFVASIGRDQDRIARNFHIGLVTLLVVVMCFLGILVNAYRSASDIKRSSATNLVSIDHGSTSEKSHLDRLNYAHFMS